MATPRAAWCGRDHSVHIRGRRDMQALAIATARRVTAASERAAMTPRKAAAPEQSAQSFAIDLPVKPPVLPMLAKRVSELPPGEGWIFEPKWDGFRTLIFRDGDEVFIQSRDERPFNRYFPELIDPIKKQLPKRCVS